MGSLARTAAAALIAVVSVAGLSGCALRTDPGAPPLATRTELNVGAAWLDDGRMIALVTTGSSTCIPEASTVRFDDRILRVTLAEPEAQAVCSADLAPRATLVPVPLSVVPAQSFIIAVTYGDAQGFVALPVLPGVRGGGVTDYRPSVGWVSESRLAILTWGSSSCKPAVQDVVASGDGLTVRFADAPAGRACTMDMGPRAALATVPAGFDGPDDAIVTFSGGGVDGKTRVLGAR